VPDSNPGIYVEILIHQPLERIWQLTQDPSLHQRWDLRFTRIEYLPRASSTEPQEFLYETRIGFGLAIKGTGESIGERILEAGDATSSLKFASDDPKSLIREGSGYWRYVPTESGLRFFTWYDYQVRFGVLGRFLDRLAFRPLIGWATARLLPAYRILPALAWTALGGIVAVYLVGVPVFAAITGTPLGVAIAGSAIFLPGDLAKVVVTVFVAKGVHRAWPGLIAPRPWPWQRDAAVTPAA